MTLLDPRVWLVFILALAGAVFGGYVKGEKHGKAVVTAEWNKQQLVQAAATAKLVSDNDARNAALLAAQAQARADEKRRYDEAMADLNTRYAAATKRLRFTLPADSCRPVVAPGQAAGPGLADRPAAATVELPPEIAGRLFDAARAADEIVEKFRRAQQDVRDAGCYAEPTGVR